MEISRGICFPLDSSAAISARYCARSHDDRSGARQDVQSLVQLPAKEPVSTAPLKPEVASIPHGGPSNLSPIIDLCCNPPNEDRCSRWCTRMDTIA